MLWGQSVQSADTGIACLQLWPVKTPAGCGMFNTHAPQSGPEDCGVHPVHARPASMLELWLTPYSSVAVSAYVCDLSMEWKKQPEGQPEGVADPAPGAAA